MCTLKYRCRFDISFRLLASHFSCFAKKSNQKKATPAGVVARNEKAGDCPAMLGRAGRRVNSVAALPQTNSPDDSSPACASRCPRRGLCKGHPSLVVKKFRALVVARTTLVRHSRGSRNPAGGEARWVPASARTTMWVEWSVDTAASAACARMVCLWHSGPLRVAEQRSRPPGIRRAMSEGAQRPSFAKPPGDCEQRRAVGLQARPTTGVCFSLVTPLLHKQKRVTRRQAKPDRQ